MMRFLPRTLFIIIGAALLVRLIFLVWIVTNLGEEALLVSDAPRFLRIAEALVAGHGFTLGEAPFAPSAFFPPAFLSVLGASLAVSGSVIPAVLLHVVLGAALPLFVWGIAGFLTENPKIRLLAAGLAAFEPQMILWSIVPTTEMIAVFTLTAAFYFFLKIVRDFRWPDALFSGLFLGLSTLTRPHGQFLFMLALLLLLVLVFLKRINWRPVALFAAVFLLVLAPWLARNYSTFGTLSVSTTGPRNIYSDYAVAVRSLKTGIGFGELRSQMYDELAQKYGVSPKEIREDPAFGGIAAREGLKIIAEHPAESGKVLAVALWGFFTQDLYTFYLEHFRALPELKMDFSPLVVLFQKGPVELVKRIWDTLGVYAVVPLFSRAFWILLDILSLAGLFLALRSGSGARLTALLMLAVILYYAATSAVGAFSDQGRLRYPVNSLIFILASYGAMRIFLLQQKRRTNFVA